MGSIWSRKPTKFSIFLWRLRWGFSPSFRTFKQWGLQAPDLCFLCVEQEETVGHLFFNCPYSKMVIIDMSTATGHALWNKVNSPALTATEGLFWKLIQLFSKHINYWRLLGVSTWHIWKERNRRLKLQLSKPLDEISKEAIRDVHLSKEAFSLEHNACLGKSILDVFTQFFKLM